MDAQFFKRLEQMRAGIPNNPSMIRQYTDKGFLCMDQEKALQSQADLRLKNSPYNFNFQQSMSSGIKPSINSVVQLDLENRVDITTMCKNTDVVLTGKYFLCRTLAPPFKMTAIMTVVEDPEGEKALRLALYNYSFADWSSLEAMCEELPVGQILVIKNPWFKSTQDGGFALRCDNPGDLVFLSTVSFAEKFPTISWKGEIPIQWRKYVKKAPETAEEWKNEGNELFRKANYEQAVEYYTTGLQLKPREEVTKALLSNRAAAYIAMRCFRTALKDLDKLLSIDPRHEKGNYRKAKCLIGLQLYTDAITFLEGLPLESRTTFDALLESASSQYKQQTTGSYDIMKLYTSEATTCHEDVADYVGPVRKEHIPGKGRGLVATRDISAGEVLLVSKAFDVVFPPKTGLATVAMSINFETNFVNLPGHDLLVKTIAQRVKLEPELAKQLYELYAGTDLSSWSTEACNENGQLPPVDLKRIDSICTYNAFSDCAMGTRRDKRAEPGDEAGLESLVDKNDLTGLWLTPSYINHSCWNCNCRWSTFGNVMVVRAFKSIGKGEEILTPYISPQDELDKRQKIMKKHAFVCPCQLCLLDSDTSAVGVKRRELFKKIEELTPKNESEKWKMTDAKQVLKLIKELLELKLPQIHPRLIPTLFSLGMYFTEKGNIKQSTDLMLQCHSLTENSPLIEIAVQASVNVIGNLLLQNKIQAAQKWIETLKRELMVCYGTIEIATDLFPHTTAVMAKAGISL